MLLFFLYICTDICQDDENNIDCKPISNAPTLDVSLPPTLPPVVPKEDTVVEPGENVNVRLDDCFPSFIIQAYVIVKSLSFLGRSQILRSHFV